MLELAALERIYGARASAQQGRYAAALESFTAIYGPGPVEVFRAPGRVNLIGEHTDYNHGYVLPVALDRDVLVLARPRVDQTVRLHNAEARFSSRVFEVGPSIPSAPPGDWSNFVRGAAQMVAQNTDGRVRGLNGLVVAAQPYGVPRGAGLSSSSALTVASALALAHANGWRPDSVRFARLCSDAEWYVGTRGGIMDQFISLLALPGRALFLDCRPLSPDQYVYSHVPLPPDHSVLVADSGVHHANVRGEFNLRVAACRAGVACLRRGHPSITHLRDVQDVGWPELSPLLPDTMTVGEAWDLGADLDDVPLPSGDTELRVRACCHHVHSENDRVHGMVAALNIRNTSPVGELLNEAHRSARDDYDISCPEVEALVGAARAVDGTTGARLTGAGWGGCIVALVRDDAVPAFEAEVPRRYHQETGLQATVFACQAGGGAGRVTGL